MLNWVTSSLTFTKRSYSSSSFVNSFTSSEPLTESVSSTSWFISSDFARASLSSLKRVTPTFFVGMTSRGTMAIPTRASFGLMASSAMTVVTTVATLETTDVSVPEMTLDTPSMSEFMRVMMSPCFSVVKKLCGMLCRCAYIWFFMSKMMRELIQALM